ncbi:hypothetical protein KZ327_11110, partial [Glaesserella parasuis]|nr:hypothetical protein [Glaesserella parasuis]
MMIQLCDYNPFMKNAGMEAKARKVTVVEGQATFADPHTLVARDRDGHPTTIKFDNAIIAA